MFENLHFYSVVAGTCVVWPNINLFKWNPIKHSFRQTIKAIRQFFRIRVWAANTFNDTNTPPDVCGRTSVTRRTRLNYLNFFAYFIKMVRGLCVSGYNIIQLLVPQSNSLALTHGSVTPTKQSLEIIVSSLSSVQPFVPSGRIGMTIYRISALESCVRIVTLWGMWVPNSFRTARGS